MQKFHLYMAEEYSIGYMYMRCTYHFFIIPSLVDGPLHCFQTLAVVNNVPVNKRVHISLQISVFRFFGLIPRSRITESNGISILNLLRSLHLLSIIVIPVYIPTSSAQGFPSLHILANTYYLFYTSHSHQK